MSEPHELTLFSSGENLALTVFEPEAANGRGVLFIHGWRSSQQSPRQFARKLADIGFVTVAFDLRGGGDSDGDINELTRRDYLSDCRVAFSYLATRVSDIAVVGSSFGAYLACCLSANRPVSTLVLRVPANYTDEGFDDTPQVMLSDRLDAEKFEAQKDQTSPSRAVDALAAFAGPTLILEAENDDIVHHDTVMRYVNAAQNGTHVVLPGAPHNLATADLRRDYQERLVEWFTTH